MRFLLAILLYGIGFLLGAIGFVFTSIGLSFTELGAMTDGSYDNENERD